jgi:dihydroorotate dehydrogenase (NAD+) catalytic subunit
VTEEGKPFVPDTTVSIAGIGFKNPVLVASGTFGYGIEFARVLDLQRLGGIVLKTITLKARAGNPPPRIAETPSGILNSIGLQNVGVDALLNERLPLLDQYDLPIIANAYGETIEEFVELADRLSGHPRISAIELNLSCPNLSTKGKWRDGSAPDLVAQDAQATAHYTKAVRAATKLPIFVKLSPAVTAIAEVAVAAEDAGADAVSLINTIPGMVIDLQRRRPFLGGVTGGLSGPAIRPIAVRMVWEVARAVNIPVIGMGGIRYASDALEFLIAGATAIAVGSANFADPTASLDVIDGIEKYMARNSIKTVEELTGSLELPS